jgi:hypothetical protein
MRQKTTVSPMALVIEQAQSLGYVFNCDPFNSNQLPRLSKYEICQKVKEWIFETFEVYTWVVPHADYTFTPMYRDLKVSGGNVKRSKSSDPREAFIEGLLFVLEYVNERELKSVSKGTLILKK